MEKKNKKQKTQTPPFFSMEIEWKNRNRKYKNKKKWFRKK